MAVPIASGSVAPLGWNNRKGGTTEGGGGVQSGTASKHNAGAHSDTRN